MFCARLLQSCPTLCDPWTVARQREHGIFKIRILKRVVMPSSRGSSWPKDWTCISWIADGFFNTEPLGKLANQLYVYTYPFPLAPPSHPLLLPSIFPSIRVFSNESVLHIKWPEYWSFNFSISPSNEYSGLISFRMDWLDLLAVQGTLLGHSIGCWW